MILLTGASGYLGRHVLAKFQKAGTLHRAVTNRGMVWGELCDLTDPSQVKRLCREPAPSVIVHCAAKVPKTPDDYEDATDAYWSVRMVEYLIRFAQCPIVFASSMTATEPTTAYAQGKFQAERMFVGAVGNILRLPGLFGLPRRSGVIYDAAATGVIPESFGPYPAMHVQDAAEYLVRAATMPSDGKPEPFSVTYGDARLERVYGSLGVTFGQRVREFAEQLREVPA